MSIPAITGFAPVSAAKFSSVPVTITGYGFFGGGASFDVQKVTIGGALAYVLSGGSDTAFQINSPVVTNSGSFDVVVTTSVGVSVGGPQFVYTEFNVGQDRSIDYKTAEFWCYGCPFLEIKNSPRPPSGQSNPMSFDNVEPSYHHTTKTHYWCGSPNVNFKQIYMQDASFIGVGWCPYFSQKWDLLYSQANDY